MDDVAHHHLSRGDGSVTLGRSASCDLTPLAPRGYREAFYFELSYAEGYGEIAYDYLKGNEETAVNTARPPTTSEKHGCPGRRVSRGCNSGFLQGNSPLDGLVGITYYRQPNSPK